MSIYYNKTHGISFWDITEENELIYPYPNDSWEDFFLVPYPRPDIVDGAPNLFVYSIPGTSKRVDITDTMPGRLTFGKRQGTWEFYVDHDKWPDWMDAFNALVGYFHGKRMLLCLNDDPTKYYTGVVTVTGFDPGKDYSKVTLSYDLDHGYWDFSDENVPVPPSDRFPDWPEIFMRIRFIGRSGSVIDSQYLMCGDYPTAPADPVEDGYTFTGWSPSIHRVTGNCDYRAQFTQNEPHNPTPEQTYRYRFLVPDQDSIDELKQDYEFENIQYEVLEEGELKRGETPRVPAYTKIPKIENMKFNKWDPDVKPLKRDTDFYARYTAINALPDRIWIAIHPTKMFYSEGETIDLTGIKVEALNKDGTLWTSEKYPKGVVPVEELLLGQNIVDRTLVQNASYSSTCNTGYVIQPIPQSNFLTFEYYPGYFSRAWIDGIGTFVAYGNSYWVLAASSDSSGSTGHRVYIDNNGVEWGESSTSNTMSSNYTFNEKTVYYSGFASYFPDDYSGIVAHARGNPESFLGPVAWTLVYGTLVSGQQEITIGWQRPGDNQVLETTLSISIDPGVSG